MRQKQRVFLSYSRDDAVWRDRLLGRLQPLCETRGVPVFVDVSIRSGDRWKERLEEELLEASVVALMVSEASESSEYCVWEKNTALAARGKRVVWFSIDGTTPPDLSHVNSPVAPDRKIGNDVEQFVEHVCHGIYEQIDPDWRPVERVVDDRYQLKRKLGGGLTSATYLAEQAGTHREVVIKMARDREAFEAQIAYASRIPSHRALVPIYEAALQKDPPCAVIGFVRGESLRASLRDRGRRPAQEAVNLLHDLGSALLSAGVQHRNLRPSKVLLDADGHAHVCGLSRPQDALGARQLAKLRRQARPFTDPAVEEQIRYLVPEHFSGDVGDRSDQYLLALMAWEMLTGAMPTTVANPEAVLKGDSPRFRDIISSDREFPGCPERIRTVLLKMAQILPEERYPNLSDALEALGSPESVGLHLARESYARILESNAEAFFTSLYSHLFEVQPSAQRLFKNLDEEGWKTQHSHLQQAILMLLAFHLVEESGLAAEPNILTRLAVRHADEMEVKAQWYKTFRQAIVSAAQAHDPWCEGAWEAPIENAWRQSIARGLRYMAKKTRS